MSVSQRPNLEDSLTMFSAHSMGASFNSDPINMKTLHDAGFQINWANGDTPVGTIAVQVSLDKTIWTSIGLQAVDGTIASTVAVSGDTGSHFISVLTIPSAWMRIVYTRTSGDGELTSKVIRKGRSL